MKRRTFIVAGGSAMLATAGCLATSNTSDDASADETPATDTPTPADPAEGDAAGASFDDIPCPSFSDSADRTVCSHTVMAGATPVYPTVSEQVFTPTTGDDSVETMAITLHNDSGVRFGLNPHAWTLERWTGDGWEHVAPEEYVEPWQSLAPGETFTWELSVESHPTPQEQRRLSVVEDLESGTYAFGSTGILQGAWADGSASTEEETNVECIGIFRVSRS
ncbi:hypothetical protein BRD19_05975 [Halobacteriales archaeon SW_7_65_23]|jgi:hypothetical protein|nr:MAG: hypothetical protein BRD19_05975 [Halobacteriales archaeon SW_7_65_23]